MPQKRRFFKAMKLTLVPAECIPDRKEGPGKAETEPGGERLPLKRRAAPRVKKTKKILKNLRRSLLTAAI